MVRIDEVTPFQGGAIAGQSRQAAVGQGDVVLRAGVLHACEDEAAATVNNVLQSAVEVAARRGRVGEAVRRVTSLKTFVGNASRKDITPTNARISRGLSV